MQAPHCGAWGVYISGQSHTGVEYTASARCEGLGERGVDAILTVSGTSTALRATTSGSNHTAQPEAREGVEHTRVAWPRRVARVQMEGEKAGSVVTFPEETRSLREWQPDQGAVTINQLGDGHGSGRVRSVLKHFTELLSARKRGAEELSSRHPLRPCVVHRFGRVRKYLGYFRDASKRRGSELQKTVSGTLTAWGC